MKKLFTLLIALFAAVGISHAQDLIFNETSAGSTFIGTHQTPNGETVAISSSVSFSSNGIQLGSSASGYNSNYLEVLGSKEIEKVSFLMSGNGTNKALSPYTFGWIESATSNDADTYRPHEVITTKSSSYSDAQWFDYDYSDSNVKCIRIYKNTKNINSVDPNYPLTGSSTAVGSGETIKIWGIKIWLKEDPNAPSIKVADASIQATESGVAATQEIEITGKNLEGTTLTATLNPEVDGLSVKLNNSAIQDGEISTTATLTYFATANASGTTTLTLSDGTTSKDVKIEYTAAVEPLVALSATSGKIELKSYETTVQGDTKVTLTGSKLKNGTYNVVADEAVTVTPAEFTVADGNVNQEFTVTTSVSTAATYQITFGNDDLGVEPPVYTFELIRPAKRDLLQSEVTEATTWDWSKAPVKDENVLLTIIGTDDATVDTDPRRGEDFLLGSLPEIVNNDNFNSQALMVNCQYAYRNDGNNGKYFQGNSVEFKTTVPGTVEVLFSNTSTRTDNAANRRYLYVNGVNTGIYTLKQTFETAKTNVEAGTVLINAFTGEDTPAMVHISKIVFTPIELPSVTISSTGLTTFSSNYGHNFADVEGLGAFIVTEVTDNKVTLEEVTTVPEGTGLILCGAIDGVYTLPIANVETTPENPVTYAIAADNKIETNLLKAVLEQTTIAQGQGFVLDGDKPANHKFVLVDQETTLEAGTAYLPKENANIDAAEVPISNDPTGIENILIDRIDGMNDGFIYDLYGRRVDKISKGIYIINGKKVLVK